MNMKPTPITNPWETLIQGLKAKSMMQYSAVWQLQKND